VQEVDARPEPYAAQEEEQVEVDDGRAAEIDRRQEVEVDDGRGGEWRAGGRGRWQEVESGQDVEVDGRQEVDGGQELGDG